MNDNEHLNEPDSQPAPELESHSLSLAADAGEAAPAMAPMQTHEPLLLLAERMDELTATLAEANRISRERERIIDRLHDENQKMRSGEVQQMIDPVLRDLVRLYDELIRTTDSYAQRNEALMQEVLRDWRFFAEMVADILYRQGIERMETKAGDPFDPMQHRACAAVPAPEQARDRTIARLVRTGFCGPARVLRPADVEVFRFKVEEGSESGTANDNS